MSITRTYGNRYAVIERAGSGGMAEVYRARDELLGREVALKVLSERLSGDNSFVERFRREAQAAANLSHPNIVSLYDYGADGGTYFIVMEYIDGKSLSDIISAEAPLMPERAADIAAEAAGALDRAHSSGLVHRDIKPGNIMISSAGQTKVTDFGIARALSRDGDQTMTQTGMVIGTAAYLSPEQAQGNPVDARSDVYSLGCVLHEMVTGRPPFSGDTPLSIAYKHVREPLAAPSTINPDVPSELDAIVMKAMAKNPDNRYASALEMKQDLERFLSGQRVHATPLLGDETTVAVPAAGGTQVLHRTEVAERVPEPRERRRGAGFWLFLSVLILTLFGLLAWLLLNNLLDDEPPPQAQRVEVPDVVGDDIADARSTLEDAGFEVSEARKSSTRNEGQVIEQDPGAGERVEEGSTIELTVSKGRAQVTVPLVTGVSEADARAELEGAGLEVGEVTDESSDEVDDGLVLSQDPAEGTKVDKGSVVDLVISSGAETVVVPSVVGMTEDEATAELEAAGFAVEAFTAASEEEEGTVLAQDPGGGSEASPGDTVRITVSEGAGEQPLPDVTGSPATAAEQQLENDLGLVVSQADETEPCTLPPGSVCRMSPEPGTPVAEGDEVTLFVQPNP